MEEHREVLLVRDPAQHLNEAVEIFNGFAINCKDESVRFQSFPKNKASLSYLNAFHLDMMLLRCMVGDVMEDTASKLDVRADVFEQALSHLAINRELGKPGDYTDAVDRFINRHIATP